MCSQDRGRGGIKRSCPEVRGERNSKRGQGGGHHELLPGGGVTGKDKNGGVNVALREALSWDAEMPFFRMLDCVEFFRWF